MSVKREKECSLFKFRVILALNSKQMISKAAALEIYFGCVCVSVRALCTECLYFLRANCASYVQHTRNVISKATLSLSFFWTQQNLGDIQHENISRDKTKRKKITTLPDCRSLNFFPELILTFKYIFMIFLTMATFLRSRSPLSVLIFY